MPDPRKNPAVQSLQEVPPPAPQPIMSKFTAHCHGFEFGAMHGTEEVPPMAAIKGKYGFGEAELIFPFESLPDVIAALQGVYDENKDKLDLTVVEAPKGLVIPR